MRAITSDQEDRRARRAERSSRSSTRTANGSKRERLAPFNSWSASGYHHLLPLLPKMIDILFNSFTCDAVSGTVRQLRGLTPAQPTPTEQILWRKNRLKRRSRTSLS